MPAEMIFWDVQHGHAVYLRSPNYRHVVVDLGTGSTGSYGGTFSPLTYLRSTLGVGQLDRVVVTHPHRDHIDDIFNFESLLPKTFLRPTHLTAAEVLADVPPERADKHLKYLDLSARYNQPLQPADDPSRLDTYGGLTLEDFRPNLCPRTNLNNHSIVVVVTFMGIKVVLPGDNEPCSLNELLALPAFRTAVDSCDVLLAPHHGRESGYLDAFVRLANPRLTIISDGPNPATSAAAKYAAASRGWTVVSRRGGSEKRYCLTTRRDGVIAASFGLRADGSPFLDVTID